ncbi:hypothetical protein [Endozoicomonas sp. ISHI1]|uniref:hypothetical protein n=2 Tax=Endozoicomonas TaxID=305899 RepID=UPI002147FB2C|nr:hypothetical protein [Endozoicomonas sp. ISHI1]
MSNDRSSLVFLWQCSHRETLAGSLPLLKTVLLHKKIRKQSMPDLLKTLLIITGIIVVLFMLLIGFNVWAFTHVSAGQVFPELKHETIVIKLHGI